MSESAENPSSEELPAPTPALADVSKEPAATALQPQTEVVTAGVPADVAADVASDAPAELPTAGAAEGAAPPDDAALKETTVAASGLAEAGEAAEAPGPAGPAAPPAPAVPDLSPAACAALLAERFPALFKAGRALPIKLRIQADIQQRAPGLFSKKSLSIFLHRTTTSTAYLRALVQMPQRFDLDGVAAGEVAEEHRAAAAVEVERRRGIAGARRQAERDAEREARRQAHRAAPLPASGAAGAPNAASAPVTPGGEAETASAGQPQTDQIRRPPRPRREGPAPQGARPPRPPQPQHEGAAPRPASDRPPRHARPMQQRQHQQLQPGLDGAAAVVGAAHADANANANTDPQAHARADTHAPVLAAAATPARPAPPPPAAPLLSPAELEARRERATLLRMYEASTITRANFCVLKRISEAALETQLVVARQERELRPPAPRQEPRCEPQRPERGPWPNNRNERSDRGAAPGSGGGPGRTSGRPPGKPSR